MPGVSVAPTPDAHTPSIGLLTPGALCRFAVWSLYVKRSACDLHEQFWLACAPAAYVLASLKCFFEQCVVWFRDAQELGNEKHGRRLDSLSWLRHRRWLTQTISALMTSLRYDRALNVVFVESTRFGASVRVCTLCVAATHSSSQRSTTVWGRKSFGLSLPPPWPV